MKITLMSFSVLMFSLTSVQAETFQPNDWYVLVYHSGCVSMSEMYQDFPYFAEARTPQEWLERLRAAPPGSITGFGMNLPVDTELEPFIEVMKDNPDAENFSDDPRFTKTNAVTLVSKKDREGGLTFFRGDLCNALFNRRSR